jgi:hypothetical protein
MLPSSASQLERRASRGIRALDDFRLEHNHVSVFQTLARQANARSTIIQNTPRHKV